jgi:uncharacterized protein (DUF111 family)
MTFSARLLGEASVSVEKIHNSRWSGTRLLTDYIHDQPGIAAFRIQEMMGTIFNTYKFEDEERHFVQRAFDILCQAEARAHNRINHTANTGQPPGDSPADLSAVHLHEAQDLLVDICGAARALWLLHIDLLSVLCLEPVFYGGGSITFSHGSFRAPAPATQAIINQYDIPIRSGPVGKELLTPTGAAILSALSPRYVPREDVPPDANARQGTGLGTIEFTTPSSKGNGLRVYLQDS